MASITDINVAFRQANHDFSKRWLDFNPSTQVLHQGWVKAPGRRPLVEDLIFHKDVAIPLRGGLTIWADIFRPTSSSSEPVPAIIAWSPYGKEGNGFQSLDAVPFRAGIPRGSTSDLEKFEAPDPAEWCPRGYAIVNVDPCGVFDSEGDIAVFGTQEARDGYDAVEYIASCNWCTGAVALAGNSWLAVAQWFIAAERPPHLKAIAPWEGLSDYYREQISRGGIPNTAFSDYRSSGYCGKNRLEDTGAMIRKYPLVNDYWNDKRARLGLIDVPIYCLASFSSSLHTEGSIRGFLFSASTEKWYFTPLTTGSSQLTPSGRLRIHHTQEWHDLYQQAANDDLQKFFDRYLRGRDNGWEATPSVRHSLLGYNCPSVVDRAETAYPPDYVKHSTFFLDCDNRALQDNEPTASCSLKYLSDSWDDDGAHFSHKFNDYTELIGFSKVKLYMSCADTDDMDVYVVLRKLDKDGRPLLHMNIPIQSLPAGTMEEDVPHVNIFKYVGPNGRLRASHRRLEEDTYLSRDQSKMLSPADVWHPHDREEKIPPGQVTCIEIAFWPGGIIYQAGESIRLEIKGHEVTLPEFPALDRVPTNLNRGYHVIYSGPDCPSSIVLPLAIDKRSS